MRRGVFSFARSVAKRASGDRIDTGYTSAIPAAVGGPRVTIPRVAREADLTGAVGSGDAIGRERDTGRAHTMLNAGPKLSRIFFMRS